MDDLISRQAALNALGKDPMGGLNYESILSRLPSVQQERKKGKWMLGVSLWYCSECGSSYSYNDYAFCPNCGADMKGERNDT